MARRRNKGKSRSIITVLLVFVAIVVGLNLGKNWIIQSAIVKSATATLHVPVSIDSLNVSLLNGSAAIKGITVGNPPGFESPHLIFLREAEIHFDLSSVMEPVMVIDSIALNGLSVYYEINARGNNLDQITKNIATNQPKSTADATNRNDKAQAHGRQFIIRDFTLTDASVSPSLAIAGENIAKRVQLADIHIRDIGRDGKTVSAAEAQKIILATLMKNIGMKLPGNLIEQGIGNLGKGVKDIGKGILGTLGQ